MDAVKHMLENNKKIARWASLPEHTPAIGWIVRGEKFYWTPGDSPNSPNPNKKKNKKRPELQYEIGSITKTMTAFRLAKGEQDGLWQASDTLAKLVPELEGSEFARSVTLRQLATHTSGLARLAKNQTASMKQDKFNPYAAYTEEDLLEAVRQEIKRAGTKHEYSNYGYGLLSWAMSRASGVAASEALRQELFDPLDMRGTQMPILDDGKKDTSTAVESAGSGSDSRHADRDSVVDTVHSGGNANLAERSSTAVATLAPPSVAATAATASLRKAATGTPTLLVPGFAPGGRPMPHWDFTSAMAGAGAVRSTVPDMLTYLEAQLGQHPAAASFESALLACQNEQASVAPSKGVGIGYAWMRSMRKDGTVTQWHNGATYGASSFAAFNRDLQSGFVILSNRGVSLTGQIKQMFGLGEMSTDRAAKWVAEALFESN